MIGWAVLGGYLAGVLDTPYVAGILGSRSYRRWATEQLIFLALMWPIALLCHGIDKIPGMCGRSITRGVDWMYSRGRGD